MKFSREILETSCYQYCEKPKSRDGDQDRITTIANTRYGVIAVARKKNKKLYASEYNLYCCKYKVFSKDSCLLYTSDAADE